MQTRTVSIFMTRYHDILSNFLYHIIGRGYTHVAIAFDDDSQNFYCFNYKGFRREHPFRRKRRYGKSICYKLDVNEEQHAALQGIIEQMEASNIEWKYCMLGVILCLLGIRHKMKNAYFCSQFVAELLQRSEIMKWRKHPSLYLPNQLCREIRAHSGLRETIEFESIEVIDENGEKIEIC